MYLRRALLLSLAAMLAVPSVALAAPSSPVLQPTEVVSDGFEAATGAIRTEPLVVNPANGNRYWGRITQVRRSGSYGLWCAGSLGARSPLQYTSYSSGKAVLDLPQLADYYAAQVDFAYTMPSLGAFDAPSFSVVWNNGHTARNSSRYPLPKTAAGAWSVLSYDLSDPDDSSPISREPGTLWFQWVDREEAAGVTPLVGQGPSIDDVVVKGWKYGRARSVAVEKLSDSSARLSWLPPLSAVGSDVEETRPLVYNVYRRKTSETGQWTLVGEVSEPRVDLTGLLSTAGYTVAVQASDEAGSGYGEPAYAAITIDNAAPIANGDTYSASSGVKLEVGPRGVLGNDTDANGDLLTARVVVAPSHGVLQMKADGSFDYVSAAGYTGTDSFTYEASDGQATASAVVTIEVTAQPASVDRLEGYDRYAVAEVLARRGWDPAGDKSWPGVTDVIIANGEDGKEADPLAGAGLAGAYEAPLLLIRTATIPNQTRRALTEIAAANPGVRVHVIGGTTTVPAARWNELKAIPGVSKTDLRVAGRDRYDVTAIIANRMVSKLGPEQVEGALIVNVENRKAFYDALAVSPQAYAGHWAMLGVRANSVSAPVSSVLNGALKGKPRHVVNASGYVGQPVYSAVGATARYASSTDIYRAAVQIAENVDQHSPCEPGTLGVAAKLPDALTGGVFLGRRQGLMVFTSTGAALHPEAAGFIGGHSAGITQGWVLGGPMSVPATQESQFAGFVE